MGDNPESDIAGANAFGIFSILVRTGVFRGKDNHHIHPATTVQPDVLVNNVIVACEESANAATADGCTMGAEKGARRRYLDVQKFCITRGGTARCYNDYNRENLEHMACRWPSKLHQSRTVPVTAL